MKTSVGCQVSPEKSGDTHRTYKTGGDRESNLSSVRSIADSLKNLPTDVGSLLMLYGETHRSQCVCATLCFSTLRENVPLKICHLIKRRSKNDLLSFVL